jgi:type I site-specific restriction endonuclease
MVQTASRPSSLRARLLEAASFFHQNLVMEYPHERAVADGVKPLAYKAPDLDRSVVARDQIRLIIRTFKERLFTEIFPGRTQVPKTLIFAKDDSHAEDIVDVVREEFGQGNESAGALCITIAATGILAFDACFPSTCDRAEEHQPGDLGRTRHPAPTPR